MFHVKHRALSSSLISLFLILLRHGAVDWLLWESRINAASALALWLTVATVLGPLAFLVARSRKMRIRRSVINWDS